MEIGETLLVETGEQWRHWLEQHAATASEIWLITYKKRAKRRSLDYSTVLDEAICFGWIDGIIKGVNEDYYVARWSPRRRRSNWTNGNIERARQLIKEGRMTAAGIASLPPGVAAELGAAPSASTTTASR
jgi:uncharacterized protein YdeI (YjbR/CyaY-like superfamily)